MLLETIQKIKIRNSSNKKCSTDIKPSVAEISEISQSGGFIG